VHPLVLLYLRRKVAVEPFSVQPHETWQLSISSPEVCVCRDLTTVETPKQVPHRQTREVNPVIGELFASQIVLQAVLDKGKMLTPPMIPIRRLGETHYRQPDSSVILWV
jgi:hypothetical protein